MKTFKEYIKSKKPVKFLDGPLSYAEHRKKEHKVKPKFLEGPHSFAEMRHSKKINENEDDNDTDLESKDLYDKSFHNHPDVRAQNLSIAQQRSINHYTNASSASADGHASSANINGYLRNRAGFTSSKVLHHTPEEVKASAERLSSAFTPENTNKKEITTYGGVPASVGETLEKSKKGDIHHFPGFTSTSGSSENNSNAYRTARMFARDYARKDNNPVEHVVQYHVRPGAGLSVVHSSPYNENEVLLHHGAKIEYSHSEDSEDSDGNKIKTHHVIVHPEHRPLESYDEYKDPTPRKDWSKLVTPKWSNSPWSTSK